MAKKSAIEKNKRRMKLVEKYASKRAELKAIIKDRSRDPEERFEATLKLAPVPGHLDVFFLAVDSLGAILRVFESARRGPLEHWRFWFC